MRLIAFLILMASALPAWARLGESNTEIYRRYGAVLKRYPSADTNYWDASYKFKEYVVLVTYSNNVSCCESVRPIEARHISSEECKVLMQSVGGEGQWSTEQKRFDSQVWKNAALGRWALLSDEGSGAFVTIMTDSFLTKQIAEGKLKERSKAAGF